MLLQINSNDAFWLQKRPCLLKETENIYFMVPCIPIKRRKLHFQAYGVNVIYRVERDRWWRKISCGSSVQWYHRSQCQWRNPPQTIWSPKRSINTCSCACVVFLLHMDRPCGQSDPLWSNLVHHLLLIPKPRGVICGNGSKTQSREMNYKPIYLSRPFLSVTAIIRANSFRFWENEGCIPSNFQFGSGHYGHDECLNSPSSSPHFS